MKFFVAFKRRANWWKGKNNNNSRCDLRLIFLGDKSEKIYKTLMNRLSVPFFPFYLHFPRI